MLRTPPPAQPVPVLETPRLRLRALTLADFPAHRDLWADPTVARFTTMQPQSPDASWERMLRIAGLWSLLGFGLWLVEEKSTHAFVGEVGLFDLHRDLIYPDGSHRSLPTPEVGWTLSPAMHGRGYATEAVRAAIDWASGRFLATELSCLIHPENTPSLRVAAKLGFTPLHNVIFRDHPAILLTRPLA